MYVERDSSQEQKKKKDDRQTVAVLGCMAERLKENYWKEPMSWLGHAYRDLPSLIDV